MMNIPQFIRDNADGVIRTNNKKVLFGALFTNYDTRFVETNDLGFQKDLLFGRGSMSGQGRVKSEVILVRNILDCRE
jgi:hypothetical protein